MKKIQVIKETGRYRIFRKNGNTIAVATSRFPLEMSDLPGATHWAGSSAADSAHNFWLPIKAARKDESGRPFAFRDSDFHADTKQELRPMKLAIIKNKEVVWAK